MAGIGTSASSSIVAVAAPGTPHTPVRAVAADASMEVAGDTLSRATLPLALSSFVTVSHDFPAAAPPGAGHRPTP